MKLFILTIGLLSSITSWGQSLSFAKVIPSIKFDFITISKEELMLDSLTQSFIKEDQIKNLSLEIPLNHENRQPSKKIKNSIFRKPPLDFSNKLIINNSAFPMKKGTLYYQNVLFGLNSFSYGLTEKLSINVGAEMLSLSFGQLNFFIQPKYSFKLSNLTRLSIGGTYLFYRRVTLAGEVSPNSVGIINTQLSIGNENLHLTPGLGFGGDNDGWSKVPYFSLSGFMRLSNNLGLVTDNLIFKSNQEDLHLLCFGGRYFWKKFAFDLGVLGSQFGGKPNHPIPYFGLMYRY